MTIVNNQTFKEELQRLQEVISNERTLVVDVETNGLDSYANNQICGVGVGEAYTEGLVQYYPFRHHQGENLSTACLAELIGFLNTSVDTFIGYNLKFDLHFLSQEGLDVTNKRLIDVIVMVRLVEHSEIKELGLTPTGRRWYGPEAVQYDIDTKKELRSNKWNKDFSMAPSEMLGRYCEQDVELTVQIYQASLKKIIKTKQLNIFNLECDLTSVLYGMEQRGIIVDKNYASTIHKTILIRLESVAQEIYVLAGKEFNISSPMQIGQIFDSMDIKSPVQTPKGKPSWNEAALVNINHRIAGLIRQHRTLEKLNSTYVLPYIDTEIMHTTFCNWGATTGRLSSRDPNLQNIPRNHFKLSEPTITSEDRVNLQNKISAMVAAKGIILTTDLADDVLSTWAFIGDESYKASDPTQISIRRLFIPRPKYSLISFDYSQMEVRVFMSYFRNAIIDELLNKEDVDFHGEAAKLAFNISEDDASYKFYRQMAKAITFGTLFGIGNKKLAQQLGTTPAEAGAYKKQYFKGMKGSKEFFDSVIATVVKRGWIRNRYGRRYQIDPQFAYKGINYLVQGTSADILSERMLKIYAYLADKKSNMLLQVHDEIICEIHDSELEELPFEIKGLLEQNSLDIPLQVDMEICSPSWATKSKFKVWSFEDCIDWESIKDQPVIDENFIEWYE